MQLIKSFGEEKMPSILNDPFKATHVERIFVSYGKDLLGRTMSARGSVEFRNGNTKGEQQFTGETFDHVVIQIKAMLETLK